MATAPPIPVQAFAPDFARRFGLIIAALVALIARRLLREPRLALLIIPLCTRLSKRSPECRGAVGRMSEASSAVATS
jgi:hypothetical protein